MKPHRFTIYLTALIVALPAFAHDLQYMVSGSQAVVVKLFYADNTPFTFEGYEIYREGEKLPYQIGRTDSQGRIAFLPDRAATWRIKAISEDGHGLDFKLATGVDATVVDADKPFIERHGRVVVGAALILGLFGVLNLFLRRKKAP